MGVDCLRGEPASAEADATELLAKIGATATVLALLALAVMGFSEPGITIAMTTGRGAVEAGGGAGARPPRFVTNT